MFAAPPPLEAVRLLLSGLATRGRAGVRLRRPGARRALLVDVRTARSRAFVGEDMYAALPPEVSQAGVCAKLNRGLYGTRAVPARREALYAATMEGALLCAWQGERQLPAPS
eukprot:1560892-Alexandrium_andersonii.AAC.1